MNVMTLTFDMFEIHKIESLDYMAYEMLLLLIYYSSTSQTLPPGELNLIPAFIQTHMRLPNKISVATADNCYIHSSCISLIGRSLKNIGLNHAGYLANDLDQHCA